MAVPEKSDSLHEIFLDLVTARNCKDEEILQDCIDRLGAIMEGKKLVPIESTYEMDEAGDRELNESPWSCGVIYSAMLDAYEES